MAYFIIIAVMIRKYTELTISKILLYDRDFCHTTQLLE